MNQPKSDNEVHINFYNLFRLPYLSRGIYRNEFPKVNHLDLFIKHLDARDIEIRGGFLVV